MIISVSGPAGSGKSTLSQRLADHFGWPRYYGGGIRRMKAKELGITLAEYNKLGETDPKTDLETDEYLKQIARSVPNCIVEGRTAWHIIPESIKIYITVDDNEGARRIFSDLQNNANRNEDSELKTVDDVLQSNRNRLKSDDFRYKKFYGIEVFNPGNYEFVIDSTNKTSEEVFSQTLEFLSHKLAGQR